MPTNTAIVHFVKTYGLFVALAIAFGCGVWHVGMNVYEGSTVNDTLPSLHTLDVGTRIEVGGDKYIVSEAYKFMDGTVHMTFTPYD